MGVGDLSKLMSAIGDIMKNTMSNLQRREFLKFSGTASALALAGCAVQPVAQKKLGRVIIVGAGYGGATAAKYLRMWSDGAIEVFLIDRNPA